MFNPKNILFIIYFCFHVLCVRSSLSQAGVSGSTATRFSAGICVNVNVVIVLSVLNKLVFLLPLFSFFSNSHFLCFTSHFLINPISVNQKDYNFALSSTIYPSVILFHGLVLELGTINTAMDKSHSFLHSLVKHFKFGSGRGNPQYPVFYNLNFVFWLMNCLITVGFCCSSFSPVTVVSDQSETVKLTYREWLRRSRRYLPMKPWLLPQRISVLFIS